jgi:2-amino-4-hydroxy-6-hydroxymethyldihydropteridine diphosphokinase
MQRKYTEAYLSLGSNLGNREERLNEAMERLEKEAGTIFARSSFSETEPWGFESEHLFLNAAIGLKTTLSPIDPAR